tara:strand:- start:289 stop:576 length:288 start_codon:yes stop_codon:yes gene_type:complete
MNIILKIKNFFVLSYQTSKTAFWLELLEAVFLIAASAILSFTILDPATKIFIPLYLIGSVASVISTYLRGSTAIVLCLWFTAMNSWAFVQLFFLE